MKIIEIIGLIWRPVFVGEDKVANASVISGSGSDISFSVVEGSLCISGAYDKNVSVVILKG